MSPLPYPDQDPAELRRYSMYASFERITSALERYDGLQTVYRLRCRERGIAQTIVSRAHSDVLEARRDLIGAICYVRSEMLDALNSADVPAIHDEREER